MKREELRARLDEARDARVDPLDDPDLVAALERDDDALLELAAWKEIERDLTLPIVGAPHRHLAAQECWTGHPTISERGRRAPLRFALAAVATAAVLLAGAAWLAFRPATKTAAEPALPIAARELAVPTRCEVLSFRASIEVVSERGISRWAQDGFGDRGVSRAAREHRVSLVAMASASPRELDAASPVGVSNGVLR